MAVTRMSFAYPEEYKQALVDLAESKERSLSAYVKQIFKKHLEDNGVELPEIKHVKVGRPVMAKEIGTVTESAMEPKRRPRRKRTRK